MCSKEAVARGYEDRLVLALLLHDASECYMSDVPRPLKQIMDIYNKQEKHLLNVIYTKFLGSTLSEEEGRQLKEIDDAVREEIPERIPEARKKKRRTVPVLKSRDGLMIAFFCPGTRYDLHICPERDLPVRREVLSEGGHVSSVRPVLLRIPA